MYIFVIFTPNKGYKFTDQRVLCLCLQKEHEHLLRPILGHPHQEGGMKNLCSKETARHTDYVSAVEEHAKELQVRRSRSQVNNQGHSTLPCKAV